MWIVATINLVQKVNEAPNRALRHEFVEGSCTLRRVRSANSKRTTSQISDPNDKLMADPYEFLVRLERQLKFYDIDTARYGTVLVNCVPDRLMQDWIEQNILATCTTWDEIKHRFRQKYDDPNIKNKLIVQLARLSSGHVRASASVHGEVSVARRTRQWGRTLSTRSRTSIVRARLYSAHSRKACVYRAEQTQRQGFGFEFKTLACTLTNRPAPARHRRQRAPSAPRVC